MAHLPNIDANTESGAQGGEADVCSDVGEKAEQIRLVPETQQRQQQRDQEREQRREHHKQLALRGIPEDLYDKAEHHQDQLTEEERQLFLSRGDVIGKALAYPDSLGPVEIHEILLWPEPFVTTSNIRRATYGTLSTPVELYAKAQDALDRGEFETIINEEETALLARFFFAPEDNRFFLIGKLEIANAPASGTAFNLLCSRLGLPSSVREAAMNRMRRRGKALALDRLGPAARDETPQETFDRTFREHRNATLHSPLQDYQRQLYALEAANSARILAQRAKDGTVSEDSWMGTCQPRKPTSTDPAPGQSPPNDAVRMASSRTT